MKNKKIRTFIEFKIRRPYRAMYRKVQRALIAVRDSFYPNIYYHYWSRDCDMCESERIGVWSSGQKRFDMMQEEESEWCDGPFSYSPISKEEYLERKGEVFRTRDRILEAFENGNGTSIYV